MSHAKNFSLGIHFDFHIHAQVLGTWRCLNASL
jgi:hypothetical protein